MYLTPDLLRDRHLNGMPLTDPKGRPMLDAAVQHIIKSTEAAFQRRYNLRLTPTYVRLGDRPIPGEPGAGERPTLTRDAAPLVPRVFEGSRHASLKLPVGPVRAVYSVGLKLPGQQNVTPFPGEWVVADRKNRVVQLYPGSSLSAVPLAQTGFGLSALYSGRTIPGAWQVAYEAGYSAEDLSGDDADVGHALGTLATIGVLVPGSIDRFTAQGITGLNVGVDGLSQGTQLMQGQGNIKYAALIAALKEEYEAWHKVFDARRGFQMGHA